MSLSKKMILELVREGKLSIEDGEKLLNSLEAELSSSPPPPPPPPPPTEGEKKGGGAVFEDLAGWIREKGEKIGQTIGSRGGEGGQKEIIEDLTKTVGGLVKSVADVTRTILERTSDEIIHRATAWQKTGWRFADNTRKLRHLEKELPASGIHHLIVKGGSDKVSLSQSRGGNLQIAAEIYMSPAHVAADAEQVVLRDIMSEGVLTLSAEWGGVMAKSFSVYYQISVPANLKIEITTADGPVELEGVSGREVRIETAIGAIQTRDLQGEIEISTQEGDCHLHNPRGTLRVKNLNGNTIIKGGEGNLFAESRNGNLFFQDCQGKVTAQSRNGRMVLEAPRFAVDTLFRFENNAGITELSLPPDGSYNLSCEARESQIRSSLESLRITAESETGQTWSNHDGGSIIGCFKTHGGSIIIQPFRPR